MASFSSIDNLKFVVLDAAVVSGTAVGVDGGSIVILQLKYDKAGRGGSLPYNYPTKHF